MALSACVKNDAVIGRSKWPKHPVLLQIDVRRVKQQFLYPDYTAIPLAKSKSFGAEIKAVLFDSGLGNKFVLVQRCPSLMTGSEFISYFAANVV